MMTLQEYLTQPRDFERGLTDCGRFAADWASIRCGKPVGEQYRKDIGTAEAMRILQGKSLGLILKEELLKASPLWVQSSELEEGAIAIVRCAEALGGETLGIITKERVVIFCEDGCLRFLEPSTIVEIWDLSHQ